MRPATSTPLTPEEIRATRIRATFLSLFSIAVVVLLLAAAWAGATLRQRTPSTVLVTSQPAGHLTFNIVQLSRLCAIQLEGQDSVRSTALLAELEPLLTATFHERAEVYFFEPQPGTIIWRGWFPTRRPQRIAHRPIVTILRESGLFLDSMEARGDSTAEPATSLVAASESAVDSSSGLIGRYRSSRFGFLITSDAESFPYEVTRGTVSGEAVAEYTTAVDLIPPRWLGPLPPAVAEQIQRGELRRIVWYAPESPSSAGRVVFELTEDTIEVPWFNPFMPEGAEE